MFDNITLVKNSLTTSEKLQVIDKNNLQCFVNEANGKRIYDNQNTKNLTGGILVKIYDDKLKIEGSVHKYFNYLQAGTLENYNVFTMENFKITIEIMFLNFGIVGIDFQLINYEIGLNIYVQNGEPLDYLKKAKSIGNLDGTQRILYVNPKYKNERFLTTQMHKDNTVIYRIYDKNFERWDKGRKSIIKPCIRIETLRTRQKKIVFSEFCKPANLTIVQNKFFAEWNKLNFDKEVNAPPGTHQSKKTIAKNILQNGWNITLLSLEEKRSQLTPKIYKTARSFIKHWDNYKTEYYLISPEISPIWDLSYSIAIQLVTQESVKI